MWFTAIVSAVHRFIVHTFHLVGIFLRQESAAALMQHETPVHRLPPELLIHIFSSISADININPTTIMPFTHVCAHWRKVAISNGHLWSRIVLIYPILPRHIHYARAFLERSGAYPIDIFLDVRDPAWDWYEESHRFGWREMEPLVCLLLQHVERWKTVELLTDTWAPIFTFLWYTKQVKSAPKLQSVSLSRCNAFFAASGQTFQPANLREPVPFFGGIQLENLTTLSLIGVHVDWTLSSIRNLTKLEFKYQAAEVMPTLQQFQSIVAECPLLLELTLYGWGPTLDSIALPGSDKIILPAVQKFAFGFTNANYAVRLLSMLVIPTLRTFTLEDVSKAVDPFEAPDATILLRWLSMEGNSPTQPSNRPNHLNITALPLQNVLSLELRCILASQDLLISFSRHFSSVRRLALFDMDIAMMNILSPVNAQNSSQNPSTLLFPSLTELSCRDMDPDCLVEIARFRTGANSTTALQNVSIEFSRSALPPADSETYTNLVRAGIEIIGRYENGSYE